jgi:hypothetical protein
MSRRCGACWCVRCCWRGRDHAQWLAGSCTAVQVACRETLRPVAWAEPWWAFGMSRRAWLSTWQTCPCPPGVENVSMALGRLLWRWLMVRPGGLGLREAEAECHKRQLDLVCASRGSRPRSSLLRGWRRAWCAGQGCSTGWTGESRFGSAWWWARRGRARPCCSPTGWLPVRTGRRRGWAATWPTPTRSGSSPPSSRPCGLASISRRSARMPVS